MRRHHSLRAELEAQRALLEEQRATIDDLRRVLEQLQDTPRPGGHAPPVGEPWRCEDPPIGDLSTDRRHLLLRGATAVIGGVVGGTALAIGRPDPADAAITETGNPAVFGVASPGDGIGVKGTASGGAGVGVQGASISGTGVEGVSDWRGVVGTADSFGVYGTCTSASGAAVKGESEGGPGVVGESTSNQGVRGESYSSDGVEGTSTTSVCLRAHAGGTGATHLNLGGTLPLPPPSSTVTRYSGSVVRDSSGDVWLCVGSGTPGSWRKISGPTTAGAFHALSAPVRVYDSRPGFPPAAGLKSPLQAGVLRSCDLRFGGAAAPAGATAVLVNLVATNTTGPAGGFLAIFKAGIAWPGTSNLNWSGPGQNVAVTTLTAVDTTATCLLFANVATDVVVDVLGYYR